jgi:ABC-type histidine transport system ATPase subunit
MQTIVHSRKNTNELFVIIDDESRKYLEKQLQMVFQNFLLWALQKMLGWFKYFRKKTGNNFS